MLTLSNLQVKKGAKTKKRRRGRGNASGRGNYSGRGIKGQRSRSGGKSGLKRLGMKKIINQLPKQRGFYRNVKRMAIVNIKSLEKRFKEGEVINAKKLLALGLISSVRNGVKILGKGELSKKLKVKAHSFSKSAKEAIIQSGGEVIETPLKKRSSITNKRNRKVKEDSPVIEVKKVSDNKKEVKDIKRSVKKEKLVKKEIKPKVKAKIKK